MRRGRPRARGFVHGVVATSIGVPDPWHSRLSTCALTRIDIYTAANLIADTYCATLALGIVCLMCTSIQIF